MSDEYTMAGIIDADSENTYIKILTQGSLDHCKDFVVKDESKYSLFRIYETEHLSDISSSIKVQ